MPSRPATVRYLGLFGAICCAVDGILFGAPTWIRQGVSVLSVLRGPNGFLIMALWIAGLTALCTAWWCGRRLDPAPRWILVTAGLWILPMLVIPPLASRDVYAYACQGALYGAGLNPSAVGVSAQPCPWIESVSVVWRDTPTPYGPLWIMLTGLAATFGSQAAALAIFRAYAVLAVVALAAAVPVLARRRKVPVGRALWLVLCCPIVSVHVVGGGHNDALAMALLVAGLALITGSARPAGALAGGGALIGAAIGVKTIVGVVLPFAALLAAGGLELSRVGVARFARRGGAVVGGTGAALVVLSLVSGLGFGWVVALSGAGESRSWTSPPTAVGIAVNSAAQWFGVHIDVVPPIRAAALGLLGIALVAIWLRFRRGDPLAGAALACLAVICLAPITQPWYLFWPLTLFAVTVVATRWLEVTIIASMFLILPNGDGAWKPLQVPLAILVTGLFGWAAWRSWRWLRQPVPTGVTT